MPPALLRCSLTLALARLAAGSRVPSERQAALVVGQDTSSIGVDIFGADGFDANDVDGIKTAVSAFIEKGIANFRLINVGAWQTGMMEAIDQAAADSGKGDKVSLLITSLFFEGPSTCDGLPKWMEFSLAKTASKLEALKNIGRLLVQLDTCSMCQKSKLYCANPTEMGMGQDPPGNAMSSKIREFITSDASSGYGPGHINAADEALPSNVEFVIPWMKDQNSPKDMVEPLVEKYIAPLRKKGRKFFAEATTYPFYTSGSQDLEPFPTSLVKGWLEETKSLGFDGFVVSETGWPHECPGKSDRPSSQQMQCDYMKSVLKEAGELAQKSKSDGGGELLTYLWHFGKGNDGSPCKFGFGLLGEDGSMRCDGVEGSLKGGDGDDSSEEGEGGGSGSKKSGDDDGGKDDSGKDSGKDDSPCPAD